MLTIFSISSHEINRYLQDNGMDSLCPYCSQKIYIEALETQGLSCFSWTSLITRGPGNQGGDVMISCNIVMSEVSSSRGGGLFFMFCKHRGVNQRLWQPVPNPHKWALWHV